MLVKQLGLHSTNTKIKMKGIQQLQRTEQAETCGYGQYRLFLDVALCNVIEVDKSMLQVKYVLPLCSGQKSGADSEFLPCRFRQNFSPKIRYPYTKEHDFESQKEVIFNKLLVCCANYTLNPLTSSVFTMSISGLFSVFQKGNLHGYLEQTKNLCWRRIWKMGSML